MRVVSVIAGLVIASLLLVVMFICTPVFSFYEDTHIPECSVVFLNNYQRALIDKDPSFCEEFKINDYRDFEIKVIDYQCRLENGSIFRIDDCYAAFSSSE